ncbi:MAG: ABC transporter permease [Megasphaera micronuciformis]|jgi:permease domain protein|nr:ABC transporter permease [Megasphaera micronuciformis]MBS7043647.1 ABC transporter permease [Megasphaera micronuciformis]
MFWTMVKGALIRQRGRFFLIALTVALGVSLAAAMLNVMFDVGDKVNQELKAFGANITVAPKNASLLNDVYGVGSDSGHKEYLNEEDLGKIKTIFWTNNIVAFTPMLNGTVSVNGQNVNLTGTWFNYHMTLPTGDAFDTGVEEMKSWWQIDGDWPKDNTDQVLVGQKLAESLQVKTGDTLSYRRADGTQGQFVIAGIVSGGGNEDNAILASLPIVQQALNLKGKVSEIEVSAITTPENDLARKAAANPERLSQAEREIWYCTAYVSSIAFQIEEVVNNSSARPVRQIAESEGKILDKTQLLMLLITVLSLISAALGVSNLVSANVMERSREIGLMKALGAKNYEVILMILTETLIAGILGGIVGYFIGMGFAQVIGYTVFGSAIANNIIVVPIVGALMVAVILLGSVPAIRTLLSLQPASVLHGR